MTTTSTAATWSEHNLAHLNASLSRIRVILTHGTAEPAPDAAAIASAMARPPALETLSTAFGLSRFETDVLLTCAGIELDTAVADALRSPDDGFAIPAWSFGRALGLLPEPHWSALAPSAPLRRWRLIELEGEAPPTRAPIRAAERVLHFLVGVQTIDPEVECRITLPPIGATSDELPASHRLVVDSAVRALTSAAPVGPIPVVQLVGPAAAGRDIAAAVAHAVGVSPALLAATDIPGGARERELFARLWEREATLSGLLLVVDGTDPGEDPRVGIELARFIDLISGPTLVLARHPLADLGRADSQLAIPPVPVDERLALWQGVLPDPDPLLGVERIAAQFPLGRGEIRSAINELGLLGIESPEKAGEALWGLCRARSRPRLEHLAERLPPASVWADLVLPEQQLQLLGELINQARQRHRVYSEWGFEQKGDRGLGLSTLFAGPSGTGKTMAAEGIAEKLDLDLYRIDLSRVVSKFIGETERNLGRIFDEADGAGGVILLFDEADALFGKRTEVRDSHDRYANLEVSYLLQRMEAYRGLAILTTNLKSSLDPAFLRRLRFVVTFPFPELPARTRIWERAFPAATPTADLRFDRLARLTVAGGNIRNIALNAAFSAAGTDGPVTMAHVLAAARSEYAKLERPLTDAETRGWL